MTTAAPTANPAPPQVLLAHHLRQLKLPTFLREYDKVAAEAAREGLDHPRYLLRLAELELIDRERRMVAALASSQAERQTCMRLARAGITQSNDIVAGEDILAAGEFKNERLIERRNGGEVECVASRSPSSRRPGSFISDGSARRTASPQTAGAARRR